MYLFPVDGRYDSNPTPVEAKQGCQQGMSTIRIFVHPLLTQRLREDRDVITVPRSSDHCDVRL